MVVEENQMVQLEEIQEEMEDLAVEMLHLIMLEVVVALLVQEQVIPPQQLPLKDFQVVQLQVTYQQPVTLELLVVVEVQQSRAKVN